MNLGFKVQVSTMVFEVIGLSYSEKECGLRNVALDTPMLGGKRNEEELAKGTEEWPVG